MLPLTPANRVVRYDPCVSRSGNLKASYGSLLLGFLGYLGDGQSIAVKWANGIRFPLRKHYILHTQTTDSPTPALAIGLQR